MAGWKCPNSFKEKRRNRWAESFGSYQYALVRSVDNVYFNSIELEDAQAVHIRTALAHRLMKTRDWEWQDRGRAVKDLAREVGVSEATLYTRKSNRGMAVAFTVG